MNVSFKMFGYITVHSHWPRPRWQWNLKIFKIHPHLTSAFAFFFDLCHPIPNVKCEHNHLLPHNSLLISDVNANADITCEHDFGQKFTEPSTWIYCNPSTVSGSISVNVNEPWAETFYLLDICGFVCEYMYEILSLVKHPQFWLRHTTYEN